jgi:hypothetical protein
VIDSYEDRLKAEADMHGLTPMQYLSKCKHDEMMREGRELFQRREYEDTVIKYYLANKPTK